MGSFIGHAIPGTFFILVGVWWFLHVILEYAESLKRQPDLTVQRSWKRGPTRRLRTVPLEPWVKITCTVAGIFVELGAARFTFVYQGDSNGNNFAHAAMYGFFALSGLVELLNFYKLTRFSSEFEYTVLALAFAIEGMLFYFHLHNRNMFDVRIHTILFMIIFTTALVTQLEACLPRYRRELFMARTILCLTQGTWFWEISYTMFGSHRWFNDTKVDLTEKQLMVDTEIITVIFCWHILGWCSVMLIFCAMLSYLHKKGKLSACCLSGQRPQRNANGDFIQTSLDNEVASDEERGLLSENLALDYNPSDGEREIGSDKDCLVK